MDGRRRELTATGDTLTATSGALCAGVDIDALRAQVAEFRAGDPEPATDPRSAAQAEAAPRAASTAPDDAGAAAEAQAAAAAPPRGAEVEVDAANILRGGQGRRF